MKILLVQISFLGDTILSTPMIPGIKQMYPNAEIWAITTPSARLLLERDPLVSGIITYDKHGKDAGAAGLFKMADCLKAMSFDVAYCLNRSARAAALLYYSKIPVRIGFQDAVFSFLYTQTVRRRKGQHQVLKYLSLISKDYPMQLLNTDLKLFPPPCFLIREDIKTKLPPYGYILIAPASAWETKMWPGGRYRELITLLLQKGRRVVLIGAPGEREMVGEIARGLDVVDLSGLCSLHELMYVMQNASLLICNDSMPLHMACAMQVPCVAMFCATTPSLGFWPWKNRARIIEKNLPCRPCGTHGGERCPTGKDDCRTGIGIEEVLERAESLIHNNHLNLQLAC